MSEILNANFETNFLIPKYFLVAHNGSIEKPKFKRYISFCVDTKVWSGHFSLQSTKQKIF